MTTVEKAIQLQNSIKKLESQYNTQYDYFMMVGGETEHDKLLELENQIFYLKNLYTDLSHEYEEKNLNHNNNNFTYALTIGSSETTDIQPCLDMWHHFLSSADGKDFMDYRAYFEKGENQNIHIHAVIQKTKKFSMSFKKLGQRYGKRLGVQHNFDIKKLTGLDILKWKNYIKKDAHKDWNSKVNPKIL